MKPRHKNEITAFRLANEVEAFAKNSFRTHGRGAVIVTFTLRDGDVHPGLTYTQDPAYAAAYIEGYDPTLEAVVILKGDGVGTARIFIAPFNHGGPPQ